MKKTITILVSTGLLITSCGDLSKKKVDETDKKVDETGQTIESGVPENMFDSAAFIEKYNAFIDFGNDFNTQVNKRYDNYFEWADYEKGPKGGKYESYSLDLSEHSLLKLEKALPKPPEINGVEDPMKEVAVTARKLYTICEDAQAYYSKEDFKEDDFAKGEVFHQQLKDAFSAYFEAYSKMSIKFNVLQDDLFKYDADSFKKDGYLIKYNMMMSLHYSENILDIIGYLDGEELKNLDLKKLDEQYANFRTSFDSIETLIKDQKQVVKEYGPAMNIQSSLESYVGINTKWIVQIRRLKERIEKNDYKYSIVHKTIPDDGSPAKLNKIYGEMVSSYNRIN